MDALAPLELDRDLPVLGEAPLGDVHLRKDLQARHDVKGYREGDRLHVHEGAIHTQAHLHHVVLRLEVNVARSLRDGQPYQLIDERHGIARDRLDTCRDGGTP